MTAFAGDVPDEHVGMSGLRISWRALLWLSIQLACLLASPAISV
ncbi:MAG: hypothetical protein ACREHV_05780 [Rhizomicrobium sp.]